MKGVIVFSPSRYSLYTITVTEMLRRRGILIKAIVVRKLINPKRFFSELGRDGKRLLKKIAVKLFFRKIAYQKSNSQTILELMKIEGIDIKTVNYFFKKFAIPIIYCNDLNDTSVIEALEKIQPSVIVFTGGGLIREQVLSKAGDGVLNCHMGILPYYRGMDVVEWPLLEGKPDNVGVTVHFMDRGVDTGDVLSIQHIKVEKGESIRDLRRRFEPVMCREMVNTCIEWLEGRIKRQPQTGEKTKQYFIMHPRLLEIVKI
jgi:folate-dependent phosphoribosylglycinamide formyltransferase PurN